MNKQITLYKKENGIYWSVITMLFGLFLGIFTFTFIGSATVVSKIFLSKVLAFFCFAGLLIPFRFYKKWFRMNSVEIVLFNLLAIGPLITSFLLWINFLVRTPEQEETFVVVSSGISTAEHYDDIHVIFTLENNAYEDYPEFRRVVLEKGELKKAEAETLKIKMAEGILGYKVFLGNEEKSP